MFLKHFLANHLGLFVAALLLSTPGLTWATTYYVDPVSGSDANDGLSAATPKASIGGILAASAFIAPSFMLVCLLSWLYFKFHELPQLQSALKGTNPVVIGLILVAAIGMTQKKVKGVNDWLLACLSFAAAAFSASNAEISSPGSPMIARNPATVSSCESLLTMDLLGGVAPIFMRPQSRLHDFFFPVTRRMYLPRKS